MLEVFESLPSLIQGHSISLHERTDVSPQLYMFSGGKYLLRKALERLYQVVNELGSLFCGQSLAQSLNEKGKSCSRMALVDTPLKFMGSHFCKEFAKVHVGVI